MPTIRAYLEKHGHEVVKPTPRLILHWWNRLLREVFHYEPRDGLRLQSVDVRRQAHEWACCHWPDPLKQHELHLTHHDAEISRRGLICILAHEIVHAILVHEARDRGDMHGSEFMRYAELIKKKLDVDLRANYSHAYLTWLAYQFDKTAIHRSKKGTE